MVCMDKLGINNYHDILNNKIAFVNQPNIIKLYNIEYDIDTNILTIYTLGREEFKLYDVNGFKLYNLNSEHIYSIKHIKIVIFVH